MKTDDLIASLVNDALPSSDLRQMNGARLALLMVLMVGSTLAASVLLYGLRPDGPSGGGLGVVLWTALAAMALFTTLRARLPERMPLPVVLAPMSGLVALLLALAILCQIEGKDMLRADHILHCLKTVGLLACVPFVAISALMRRAAPASPVTAGALAGLCAGAIGALAYSLSCPINDPMASLAAHSMTVLIITGIGALIGSRLYAW